MAINPSTKYGAQVDTGDSAGYPYGRAKNVIISGDGTGTPLEEAWISDVWGFLQQLLERVGITPTGTPDKVGASQYHDALDIRFGGTGNLTSISWEAYSGTITNHIADVSTYNPTLRAVTVSDTGHRMYTANADSEVNQFSLSSNFDQRSSGWMATNDFSTHIDDIRDMKWAPDGSKFWLCGFNGGVSYIVENVCATPWTLVNGVLGTVTPTAINSVVANASAIDFGNNGWGMYILGYDAATTSEQKLWSWNCLAPYQVAGANRNPGGDIDLPNLPAGTITGISIGPGVGLDRRLYYITADTLTEMFEGGAVETRERDLSGLSTGDIVCCRFSPDGQRFYIGTDTEEVHSMYSSLVRVA